MFGLISSLIESISEKNALFFADSGNDVWCVLLRHARSHVRVGEALQRPSRQFGTGRDDITIRSRSGIVRSLFSIDACRNSSKNIGRNRSGVRWTTYCHTTTETENVTILIDVKSFQ